MDHTLQIHLMGTSNEVVEGHMLANHIGSGSAAVYATSVMVALMEKAAMNVVEGHLAEGFDTVGIEVDVSHIAPTPLGMHIRAEAELIGIEGKILTFRVAAYDEIELVGEALHKRAIINTERFNNKAKEKLNK